jgi:hypothetical protein
MKPGVGPGNIANARGEDLETEMIEFRIRSDPSPFREFVQDNS